MKILDSEWLNDRRLPGVRLIYSECSPGLCSETQASIIRELNAVMPRFDVAQYFGSQPTIFSDYDHLVVAVNEQSEVVGMIGARWLKMGEEPFFYLWTAMVGDQFRSTPLFRCIVAELFVQTSARRGFPSLIVTKTYNPVVYNIIYRLTRGMDDTELYPNVDGPQSETSRALALRIASSVCPSLPFEVETGRVVGGQAVLAPNFFPEMQASKNSDVFGYFERLLTRDDQILCVVQLGKEGRSRLEQRLLRELGLKGSTSSEPLTTSAQG